MVKDNWFNGSVHVIQQEKHWPKHISAFAFRAILNAEAEARGGKCRCRMLEDHLMFVFTTKKTATT